MRHFLIFALSIILLTACNSNNTAKEQSSNQNTENSNTETAVHHVTIKEVLQTSSYSYFLVTENDQEYWMAVNKIDLKVGQSFYFEEGLEMIDFQSKELNRVFEKVLFVQYISDVPINSNTIQQADPEHGMPKPKISQEDIELQRPEGAISLSKLFQDPKKFEGKKVRVHGKVVKVNNAIMKRNWVHIQDGTKHGPDFDLTITTAEEVNIGDVLTFEGIVTLNKNFSHGYVYPVIIEDAVIK